CARGGLYDYYGYFDVW
nr:immunoglobulin heavy chain junction region [Mus musculus]